MLIRKWQLPLETVRTVQQDIRRISEVEYVNERTIDKVININEKYGFSYYDCLMLASALDSNCKQSTQKI